MRKHFVFFIGAVLFILIPVLRVKAQNCNCWQERDTSFHYVPFSYCTSECGADFAPYYRNDDAATSSFDISLPFNFCFWGQIQDTVYINTNGNLTFGTAGGQFTTFSPDTFPDISSNVPPMIAPFWGDVDTHGGAGGTCVVLYKMTAHYLIVQWDSVGFYSSFSDSANFSKLNSFQVIISDGTDPIVPKGNNVEFCYRQMQWTTGDASSGNGGFGGDPATIGANQGDGVRSIQIGLFASPGNNYYGQYPPPPKYDGVDWLDNKSFLFNLCSGSIAPLISGVSPCDTFKVCAGDSVIVPFYFFSPLQGDTVWSNLAPPVAPGVSITANYPGPTDSLIIKMVGSVSNLGYHVINVYGYDNSVPSDTTYTSFVVEVDSIPNVHLKAMRDTICIGDTSTLSVFGGKTFAWSTGETTSSIKVSPPTSQIYTVAISNALCTKDTLISLVVLPKPAPVITPIPDSICQGDTLLLIGSGGKTYIWSTGKTTDSIKVSPLSDSTFTLIASNGICADSTSILLKVTPRITATIGVVNDTVCPHGNTIITATGIGGQVTYKWNTGATTSSINVNDTVTTTYTATVYGVCDSVKKTMKVTVIPLPNLLINGAPWVCKGMKDTLTVKNSTNPTTYVWSNGDTTTSIITGNIVADSMMHITAYNSLGCPVKDSFKITARSYPTANITYPTGCGNSPITITANPTGTGPFTYKWNTGGMYDTINVITVSDSTPYTVVISNGCPITKTVTVVEDVPLLSACCNATILLGGDTNIGASGAGIVKYQWLPDTGLNCDTCANVVATPTVTTTYTVTGTDALGCTSERIVTIMVEPPCFNFTVPNVFTPTYSGALGVDNVFYIRTDNVSGWSIVIYDRWGKEMFRTTNPDAYWNGNTESGGQAPAGVYYYLINASCKGNTYKKDGLVQLIR